MKTFITIIAVCMAFALQSCDDGLIQEVQQHTPVSSGYTAVVTGTFKGQTSWPSRYSIVVAGFNENSDYAIIQKTLAAKNKDDKEIRMVLSNISDTTRTLEIAVVNSLRKRLVTLYSYAIPTNQDAKDTIRLDVGEMDISMFETINSNVFQGMNCSRCHSSSTAAAHLDLTKDNAYMSIVNGQSSKNPDFMRIKPDDADSSYLYRVITTGTPEVGYNHPALFVDDKHAAFVSIIKNWIDNGAKK